MAIYQLDLDMLEAAKNEYENSADKMSLDIETSYTTISLTNENIYRGIDADTFRDTFTGYIDADFANARNMVVNVGKALAEGLEDAKDCKKICNDFVIALSGAGGGKPKESMRGKLFCDQEKISSLKRTCTEAMTYADNVRIGATAVDKLLMQLQMVKLASEQYTDLIREGCDKVDRLEEHSSELTKYAVAVEGMDDSLKSRLDACVMFPWKGLEPPVYDDTSPQIDTLMEIVNKPVDELTEEDKAIIDENIETLVEKGKIDKLQEMIENIPCGPKDEWSAGVFYFLRECL